MMMIARRLRHVRTTGLGWPTGTYVGLLWVVSGPSPTRRSVQGSVQRELTAW